MFQQKTFLKTICLIAAAFLVISAAPLYAQGLGDYGTPGYGMAQPTEHQQQARPQVHKMSTMKGRAGDLQSADDFIGTEIKNSQGQTLGKVHELIFDRSQNVLYYVVLSSGKKLYPIPVAAFETPQDKCILDVSKNDFIQAPSVENLSIATLSSPEYRQKVYEFYSAQVSGTWPQADAQKANDWMKKTLTSSQTPELYDCRDVVGLDVQNRQARSIGDVEDVIFDVRNGGLAYGLVGFGGLWGIGEKTAAVPWTSLAIEPQQGIAKIDATQQTLGAVAINRDNLQRLTQPAFTRRIDSEFGTRPYWEVFGFVPPEQVNMSLDPWMPASSYNKCFDPSRVTTIEGTITSVARFHPEKGSLPGTRLKVKTTKGESVTVYAGPCGFAADKGIDFKAAGQIIVTGSKTKVNGKSVIIASEVKTEGKTLELRDSRGTPQWSRQQLQQIQSKLHEAKTHSQKNM